MSNSKLNLILTKKKSLKYKKYRNTTSEHKSIINKIYEIFTGVTSPEMGVK